MAPQTPDLASNPDIRALTTQSDALATLAQTYVVTNQLQYVDAGEQLQQIKGAQKRLETLRKSITQPIDAAKKAVMDFFRAPEAKLVVAEAGVKRAMIAFTDEQDRLQRIEQDRLNEVARKEQEKLQQQAARAAASGKTEKAAALEERAAVVVAPVVNREPPRMSGINMREVWKFEITDLNAVPREYLMVDETKIRKVVGALKGSTKIAGVRVYADKQMAAGAA